MLLYCGANENTGRSLWGHYLQEDDGETLPGWDFLNACSKRLGCRADFREDGNIFIDLLPDNDESRGLPLYENNCSCPLAHGLYTVCDIWNKTAADLSDMKNKSSHGRAQDNRGWQYVTPDQRRARGECE